MNSENDAPAFDASLSHQARVYNYLLGGKDNFAADRALAEALTAAYPGMVTAARVNRAFLGRAVRFLAMDVGISQFLDIGTGIPGPGSTHEVAQQVRPDAKIVYVDNDPVVLAHARAFLTSGDSGVTDYIDADVRKPGLILERAAQTLDLGRPVGVLLVALLHAIGDGDDPHRIVRTLMDAMPSGSYLAITHGCTDLVSQETAEKFSSSTRTMSHHQYIGRDRAEISQFFDGLELVEPGLVPAEDWRPDPQDPNHESFLLAGVGRKAGQ